jgi:hypothetical protein
MEVTKNIDFRDDNIQNQLRNILIFHNFFSTNYCSGKSQSASMPPISVLTIEDDSDDNSNIPSFNSNGVSNTPQSSRARMLAQQREIQLKKRQSALQSGGINILIE